MLTEVHIATPMTMMETTTNTAILEAFLLLSGWVCIVSLWR